MPKAVNKALSEEATQKLEAQIPAQASLATRMAYEKAKAAGRTVVLSRADLSLPNEQTVPSKLFVLPNPVAA